MCGGDEWWSETLWCDTKVMWFDWTGGGELIDSERLGVEAQQVCVGWRGPSRRFIRCCTSLIFSLNLVWLWKGGEGGGASSFLHSLWGGGRNEKRGREEEERDLCWPVRNYLTTPVWPQTHCAFSPPSSSKRFFAPLHANLHYSLCPPSFLFLSSPPSSVAGATLSGTADRYVNWAGALTRTACKIILGAAQRQVIKLNFRPVDRISTGN